MGAPRRTSRGGLPGRRQARGLPARDDRHSLGSARARRAHFTGGRHGSVIDVGSRRRRSRRARARARAPRLRRVRPAAGARSSSGSGARRRGRAPALQAGFLRKSCRRPTSRDGTRPPHGLQQKRLLVAKADAAPPPGGALIVDKTLIRDDRRENAPASARRRCNVSSAGIDGRGDQVRAGAPRRRPVAHEERWAWAPRAGGRVEPRRRLQAKELLRELLIGPFRYG